MTLPCAWTSWWRSGASISVIGRMLRRIGRPRRLRDLGRRAGRAAEHRVAELQRPLGGLQHQRRHVLAHVGQRLVFAPRRTRVSVQVADDVPADGDRLRPQHAIGDDRRVGDVGALDGDGAGRRLARRPARRSPPAPAPCGVRSVTRARPARAGAARRSNAAADLSGRHRIKAAHQPAAEPVAAKAAEAARQLWCRSRRRW